MNIFQRLQTLVTANTHHVIDLAEDPETMLKQAIRELDDNIRHSRAAVVSAVASEKKLAGQVEQHRHKVTDLSAKAESAVAAGNDDLAAELLERKLEHEHIADDLEGSWTSAKRSCKSLRQQLERLIDKRGELCRKRDTLALRQRAAEARSQVCRSMATVSIPEGTDEKFSRMRERIEDLEAESLAASEVLDTENEPERQADKAQTAARVDAELQTLKERLRGRGNSAAPQD
ncbi:MAG: PspA/IM30 family protein [Thiogranum sp.]